MTTTPEADSGAWRTPSLTSPFGLLVDLGAAVAAEAGLTPREIAQHLAARTGKVVADEVARAAVGRGRREMAARRLRPQRPLPRPAPAPHAEGNGPDIEQLLAWGVAQDGYAHTAAQRARMYLDELAALRQAAEPATREPKLGTRPRTERGVLIGYRSMVLAWAASQDMPIPADTSNVPPDLIAAYEAAHGHRPTPGQQRTLRDQGRRKPGKQPAAGARTSAPSTGAA